MANKRKRGIANFSMARLQANRVFYPHQTFSSNRAYDNIQNDLKKARLADLEEEQQRGRERLGRRAYLAFALMFLIMWVVPTAM